MSDNLRILAGFDDRVLKTPPQFVFVESTFIQRNNNIDGQLAGLMEKRSTAATNAIGFQATRFQLSLVSWQIQQAGVFADRNRQRVLANQNRRTNSILLAYFVNHQLLQSEHRRSIDHPQQPNFG